MVSLTHLFRTRAPPQRVKISSLGTKTYSRNYRARFPAPYLRFPFLQSGRDVRARQKNSRKHVPKVWERKWIKKRFRVNGAPERRRNKNLRGDRKCIREKMHRPLLDARRLDAFAFSRNKFELDWRCSERELAELYRYKRTAYLFDRNPWRIHFIVINPFLIFLIF